MAALSSKNADSIHDLLDSQVLDQAGNDIGTLHSFWADPHTGTLEFVGVKTGWIFGQNHVLPADRVDIDEAARSVRVPYDADFVKGAPSIDADAEISDAQEAEIYRYYQVRARGGSATATDTVTNTNTRTAAMADHGTTTANAATATGNTTGTARTATAAAGQDTVEVPLTEEQLRVGKRTVDAGQVRLRKIVRTEVVNQPVEVKREDVVIERVPAGEVRSKTASGGAFQEEVIDVPLTREEAVVSKEAQVTGAVRLKKTAATETQQVQEQVRKEDVEVLRDGKTITESDTTRK